MIVTIFQAILDKLNDDATIISYIGVNRVFRAKTNAPFQVPSITLMENNESSQPRVGYNAVPVRDNSPTIQIDVWVSSADESFPCTGEDCDMVSERIDTILLDSRTEITGTRSGTWKKASASQQQDQETNIWHNASRFTFEYKVTDT